MIELLESRTLFSAHIDTSSVGLFDLAGAPAVLDRTRPTWLIIHGITGSKDDSDMQNLGTAVQAAVPNAQVLLLDWSKLAYFTDNRSGVRNAYASADAIANKLKAAKIKGKYVNLMAFSMGGQLEQRIGADLKGVNRIVAVDPSAPPVTFPDPITGRIISANTNYAKVSKYSIAFYGASYTQGSTTANDTIQLTGLLGTNLEQHAESELAVLTMLRRDVGFEVAAHDPISPIFSMQNILAEHIPAWKKNSYCGVYEAQLDIMRLPGSLLEFAPSKLTYIDLAGKTVTIQ